MTNEISKSYSKALELHNKILVSAQLAQNSLWDMCTALKEMRDGKLYKELGYQNFEEYCGTEFNMSRANASKYISILENIKDVSPVKHLGVSKLYLLSTLSESEQQEIIDNNDMDSITRKELEEKVKELKKTADQSEFDLHLANIQIQHLKEEKQSLETTIDEQAAAIKEYETRPIEVAVAEPSEDVLALKKKIKDLEHNTEQKLMEQANAYEQKLAEAQQADGDDKQAFKAYFAAAYDAFNRMIEFAKASPNKDFFKEKIAKLIGSMELSHHNL